MFRSPSISQNPRHLLQNCFLFCFPPAVDVTGRLTPHFDLGAKNPIKLPSVSIKKEKVHLERFCLPYRVSSATANSLCPQVMGGGAPASTEVLTLSCDIGWVALMGSCSKPTCGVTSKEAICLCSRDDMWLSFSFPKQETYRGVRGTAK